MFKGSREYQSVFTAPITQNSYRTEEATGMYMYDSIMLPNTLYNIY